MASCAWSKARRVPRAVLGRAVDGHLPGHAEGGEQGVAAGDVQVAGNVVGGEGVGGAAHVPVEGAGVATRCGT